MGRKEKSADPRAGPADLSDLSDLSDTLWGIPPQLNPAASCTVASGATPPPHAAASIIWWDFFGGLSASKHIGLFDKWIYAYDHERDVPIEELAGVLMWVGYPPTFARRRATPPKLYDNSRRKRKPAEAAA